MNIIHVLTFSYRFSPMVLNHEKIQNSNYTICRIIVNSAQLGDNAAKYVILHIMSILYLENRTAQCTNCARPWMQCQLSCVSEFISHRT